MRVSRRRISTVNVAAERVWTIAILATMGTCGAASQADAALYYYRDYDSAYYDQPEPQMQPQPRRQKVRKPAAKAAAPEKDTSAKPQSPLIISVSLQNQKVRVFDANGLFAQSPVSSGMKGHSTPMGVFSVIQKHKFHHSNIYSNAPMPYMQRITWSGVAMHAGVLPGYPASHGCIRMPTAFAIKMWNWTKMGARVIVTPGEITPTSFSHPLLFTQKVIAQPVATEQPKVDVPIGVKGDKGADAGSRTETNLELRASVSDAVAQAALHDQTHTADAAGTLSAASTSDTISDAAERAAIAGATPVDGVTGEVKSAEAELKPTETTASTDAPKVETAKPVEPKATDKPAEPVKAADTPADEAKKDPTRLPGLSRPEVPKRTGQIAVLISRKDSKLYVRQNFAPLFEVPVVIAPDDRPLGTHIFTAEADKSDPNLLRWSVVSLPTTARAAARTEDEGYPSRRRRAAVPVEAKPLPTVDSPAEALDRITVPPDAMARIAEAITTGGSIIVSDQGINQGETGEGTDFIIPLR